MAFLLANSSSGAKRSSQGCWSVAEALAEPLTTPFVRSYSGFPQERGLLS